MLSFAFMEEAFARMDAMVLVLDREGCILFVNRHLSALLERDSRDLIGVCWSQFSRSPEAFEAVLAQLSTCGNFRFDCCLDGSDQCLRQLRFHANPVSWQDGTAAVLLVGEDLTERSMMAQALEENENLRSIVFDHALDSLITIDSAGTVLTFNKSAEKMFGYQAAEVLGHNVAMLMPNPHRERHDHYIQEYLRTGNATIIGKGREVSALHKDGSQIPVLLHVSREAELDGERVFVGVLRDLSKEKYVEAQLRQAQKMEAIGTLAGGIAHDFNNILGGIFGYVELMMEDAEEGSYLQEDLGEMMKACMRGKELVQQILTFSRQEQPQRKPAYLQPIIKESLKLLRATIPTTIDIQSDIETDMGMVVIDPTQMHQVMMNLCTNGYHAMRNSGGRLTVSLKTVDYQGQIATIANAIPFGAYAALSVSDTGEGMSDATLRRIFDPFFTTKRLGEGTGMGLSVVHGIIQNHDGLITVASEVGRGSVFTVYLPLKEIHATDSETAEPESESGQERIFLVDDDAFLRNVQKRLLERQGYHVTLFANGREALDAFETDPHAVDLIISDQTMPKMSGMEMAKAMLCRRASLPIILTTGYSDMVQPEKVTDLGVREVLMKPVPKQTLLSAIRRHLSGA